MPVPTFRKQNICLEEVGEAGEQGVLLGMTGGNGQRHLAGQLGDADSGTRGGNVPDRAEYPLAHLQVVQRVVRQVGQTVEHVRNLATWKERKKLKKGIECKRYKDEKSGNYLIGDIQIEKAK